MIAPRRTGRFTLLMVACLLCTAAIGAQAQDTLRMRYGLFGNLAFNTHQADFRALPGVPNCCPVFGSGSGTGPSAGALVEFPVASSLLLMLRADYTANGARLSEREPVRVIVNGVGRDGALEHSIDADIATVGLQPELALRLAGGLFLHVGVRGGYVLGATYAQEERIVEPGEAGTFLDSNGADSKSRIRNVHAGDIPNAASLLLHGVAGLTYELPLNARGTWLLAPELRYALALNDVVEGLAWKPSGLRVGLALKYSPAPEPPKPVRADTLYARDTVTRETREVAAPRLTLLNRSASLERIEEPASVLMRVTVTEHYLRELPAPPPMTCTLAVAGVNDEGQVSPIATLRIEEFLSTVAYPLLNYVFFEPGSAEIPARYTRLTADAAPAFRSRELQGNTTLSVYATMLNILGERMRAHPAAVLTLHGCNMDQAEEKGNIELSRKRAESVRDYLTTVWGIAPDRLRLEAGNLPEKRSNPLTPDGQGENRRVEIASTVPDVLDVLLINDTVRTSSPPIVRLMPTLVSAHPVTAWELTVAQRGTVLKRFAGEGAPPANLDWDIANDPAHTPRYSEPLAITFTASNAKGEQTRCEMALPTEAITISQKRQNRVGDYTIDRYNLILFSVGAAVITPANQRIIDLIKRRLEPTSTITAEGFADRSGSPASNQQLSALRAKATAQALGRPDAVVRGIGESRLLFSNDTPEGRYYCRTVQIMVKTPIR